MRLSVRNISIEEVIELMSTKAQRGLKRVCQSCGSKFYDLNRDPIVCPMCQTVYHNATGARPSSGGNQLDADDDAVLDAGQRGLEFVPLEEVTASEGEDLPGIEGGDLNEAEDGDAALGTSGDEETFLEAEDEGEADMSGFVSGEKEEEV